MAWDYSRMCRTVDIHRSILRQPRLNRHELIREAAGDRYSDNGADREVKVNMLSMFQSIISRTLISQNPRCMYSTFDRDSRWIVEAEQDWINDHVETINLAESLSRCVIDGLYMQGWMKVCLANPSDAARNAWGINAGTPVAMPVDPDDMVWDTNASRIDQCEFIGHRCLYPLDVALKLYGSAAKNLVPSTDRDYNKDGDERIGRILRGNFGIAEMEDHVEMWEIYYPRYRKVVTYSDSDVTGIDRKGEPKPLWIQDWVGPPWGPFIPLGFGYVPGQSLPKAPMMDLWHLHMDLNNILRKVNRQVRNFKELTVYPRALENDAREIMKSNDGDLIPSERPDDFKPLITRGKHAQPLLMVADVYRSLFDFVGGNLSLLGGRAAQSGTARQDAMLNDNAGASIAQLQGETTKFASKVFESLLWFHHHHPYQTMHSPYRVQGQDGMGAMRTVTPEHRAKVKWDRAKFRIDPYSLKHQSPQERLQFLSSIVGQMIPIMPLLAQQGVGFNANAWLAAIAKYGDAPDIPQLFTYTEPLDGGGASTHGKSMPANTSREVIRKSVTADTPGTGDALQARLLGMDMGGDPGKSEGAGAMAM